MDFGSVFKFLNIFKRQLISYGILIEITKNVFLLYLVDKNKPQNPDLHT